MAALTVSVLGLSACNAAGPHPATSPLSSSSGPAPVAGYDWFLTIEADEASLAYGLKDSDDLRLGLECRRGSGKLGLSALAETGQRGLHLESGGETERFSARAEHSELHDGDFLTADARTDEPVFQRFRRVGWLARWQGDTREVYAAHSASLPVIDRFFCFCA
jgi:hypothetical protein